MRTYRTEVSHLRKPRLENLALWVSTLTSAILKEANLPKDGYLFPSNGGKALGHLTRQGTDRELKAVCAALDLKGVSTHSFRRSALTTMKCANIPLKDIAAISGHSSLDELSRYLEVSDHDKQLAIAALCY